MATTTEVPLERLLTMNEVRERLRLSHEQMLVLIRTDGLPFVRIGKRRKFLPSALRAYLAARSSGVVL